MEMHALNVAVEAEFEYTAEPDDAAAPSGGYCADSCGGSCGEEDVELDGLVARFGHRVHFFARRVAARFGLDPQWHDDLISSGYWGLLKALRNRRPDAHEHELSAYVSKRVEGAVIDEARRALTRLSNQTDCDPEALEEGVPSLPPHLDWDLHPGRHDPENLADRQGRWRTIEAAIEHLGEAHRDLLWAYAGGASISEIARREGQPAARLQNQMTRISRQIRAHSPELRRLLRHEI
jgi:RNA polymerase sigma factor (sigma-70 family)